MFSTLIPAPYSFLARIVAILIVVVSFGTYCYVKGEDHEQQKQAVAQAAQTEADYTALQAQIAKKVALEKSNHAIATQYQQDKAAYEQNRNATQLVVADALSRVRNGPTCKAGTNGVQPVPSDRPGAAGANGQAAIDARIDQAIQHDALQYAACYTQLTALQKTVQNSTVGNP